MFSPLPLRQQNNQTSWTFPRPLQRDSEHGAENGHFFDEEAGAPARHALHQNIPPRDGDGRAGDVQHAQRLMPVGLSDGFAEGHGGYIGLGWAAQQVCVRHAYVDHAHRRVYEVKVIPDLH